MSSFGFHFWNSLHPHYNADHISLQVLSSIPAHEENNYIEFRARKWAYLCNCIHIMLNCIETFIHFYRYSSLRDNKDEALAVHRLYVLCFSPSPLHRRSHKLIILNLFKNFFWKLFTSSYRYSKNFSPCRENYLYVFLLFWITIYLLENRQQTVKKNYLYSPIIKCTRTESWVLTTMESFLLKTNKNKKQKFIIKNAWRSNKKHFFQLDLYSIILY